MQKGRLIDSFRKFALQHPHLHFVELIEFYALFGGFELINFPLVGTPKEVLNESFLPQIELFRYELAPSTIFTPPYDRFLMAVAKGEGRVFSVFEKSRLSEKVGARLAQELIAMGVLRIESSRESPIKQYKKQKIKKALRHYRIQDRYRFIFPFYRFWFSLIAPHYEAITKENLKMFWDDFQKRHERLYSAMFEDLCNVYIQEYFGALDEGGSFWDHRSEFDILMSTRKGGMVLGECKYKMRKVCKNELNKLQQKARESKLDPDIYVLFSRGGFSNELLRLKDERVYLIDLEKLAGVILRP